MPSRACSLECVKGMNSLCFWQLALDNCFNTWVYVALFLLYGFAAALRSFTSIPAVDFLEYFLLVRKKGVPPGLFSKSLFTSLIVKWLRFREDGNLRNSVSFKVRLSKLMSGFLVSHGASDSDMSLWINNWSIVKWLSLWKKIFLEGKLEYL